MEQNSLSNMSTDDLEEQGATTGIVIGGSSVDGTLSVQSFSIAGQSGPFVLGQVYTIAGVGSFSSEERRVENVSCSRSSSGGAPEH